VPVAPKARPRPRPLGKGKVKATEPEVQPDQPSAGRANSDRAGPVTGDPPTTAVSTKRKRAAKEPENQAPAPKKRKSTKPKSDTPSDAMGADGSSVAPLIGRGGPVRKSARVRLSPHKNDGQFAMPVMPSSGNHGESDHTGRGEAEPEAGSSSLATDVRPPPRPRGRPKAVPRLPPTFTDVHSSTNADAGQSAAAVVHKATRRAGRVAHSTNANTPKRSQAVRTEGGISAQVSSSSGDGGDMNTSSLQSRSTEIMKPTEPSSTEEPNTMTSPKRSRRARATTGSNVPRRQSARVAARDPPSAAETDFPCNAETAQSTVLAD
jgi:hypothetical protein